MGGGERHPLQVMAILHSHYAKLARLDGVGCARARRDAAAAMGIKPGFPARKALENYRGSGEAEVSGRSACSPPADLDLRGAKDLGGEW